MDGFEQVADYAWIKRGRKYWSLYVGNPFCVSLFKLEKNVFTKEKLIRAVTSDQKRNKLRFQKDFPDVIWRSFNPQKTPTP